MRKFAFLFCLAASVSLAYAQEEEVDTLGWNLGGIGTLNFSQVSLYQWTAGGEPSFSGAALVNVFANYYTENLSWRNQAILGYGLIRQGRDDEATTRKSDDRIEFTSQLGIEASEKWSYSGLLNFRSQFVEGYNYPDEENVISDFFAPAYLTLAAGMDYSPSESFQVFISPLSGKLTFVTNDSLSAQGAFGVEEGENFRAELGAFQKIQYKKEVFENVNLGAKIDFFSNYLENPQNIDVNLDLLISMKINEFLAATININAIYDDDVNLLQSDDTMGPGLQLKEVFGVGLSYAF